jgi:hypothetical protein
MSVLCDIEPSEDVKTFVAFYAKINCDELLASNF